MTRALAASDTSESTMNMLGCPVSLSTTAVTTRSAAAAVVVVVFLVVLLTFAAVAPRQTRAPSTLYEDAESALTGLYTLILPAAEQGGKGSGGGGGGGDTLVNSESANGNGSAQDPLVSAWAPVVDLWFSRWRAERDYKVTTEYWQDVYKAPVARRAGQGHHLAVVNGVVYNLNAPTPLNSSHIWLQKMLCQLLVALADEDTQSIVPLEDRPVAFFLHSGDFPEASIEQWQRPMPTFGVTVSPLHWDIPVPSTVFWRFESGLRRLASSPGDFPWESKIEKALFRGSPSCYWRGREHLTGSPYECPRIAGWRESQMFPDDVDVGFASFNASAQNPRPEPPLHEYIGPPSMTIGMHRTHKYLLSFDGASYAMRYGELLPLGCVVLKQRSQ